MATSVMCNDAESVLRKEKHLAIPCVGIQGPAMGECDDRTFAPVLIVNLRSIFCRDVWHGIPPLMSFFTFFFGIINDFTIHIGSISFLLWPRVRSCLDEGEKV